MELRRWIHLACVVAVGLVLAAPLLLGPALVPLARALGGAAVHLCACGMKQGECGCPECERIASATHDDDRSPLPVLKSSCDDDAPQLPSASALPPATLPMTATIAPRGSSVCDELSLAALAPLDRLPPPTPPPRS